MAPRNRRQKYRAIDSEDDQDDELARWRGRDEDEIQQTRQRRRTSRPPLTGRDKAILIIGTALIVGLLVIGIYSLWRYATEDTGPGPAPPSNIMPDVDASDALGITTRVTSDDDTTTAARKSSEGADSSATQSKTSNQTSGISVNGTHSSDGGNYKSDKPSPTFPGLSKNGIGIGMLPDYQDQTMADLNKGLDVKFSFMGWYAQLPESGEWDGAQMMGSVFKDVVESGAIFQPAVMPNSKNWNGLTRKDDYQAKAIAKVMKKFTDAGVDVWLRFAHEVNWYQTDGTYSGGPAEFKEAWATVAAAVKDNPKIRMFFTPNVAGSMADYDRYFPEDHSTVHYLGCVINQSVRFKQNFTLILRSDLSIPADFYPRSKTDSFLERVKPLYDKYCSDGKIKFAMGETGTDWAPETIEDKFAWMDQMTSEETAKAMPHYVGSESKLIHAARKRVTRLLAKLEAAWFNYDKERAYKLWKKGSNSDNEFAKKWFHDGTSQSGASFGQA
ncbi:hypothetical protein OIV83_003991 [Microbotryomycetes sp. JL201]|nr:hypothetical protein OIV83_003991 [Microbotryomycetes sp. JL201]